MKYFIKSGLNVLLISSLFISLSACRKSMDRRERKMNRAKMSRILHSNIAKANIELMKEGQSLSADEISNQINIYNKKYNININFAKDEDSFLEILKGLKVDATPKAIFQYSDGHKYGAIFVKHKNEKYCVFIDTIPTLSKYTKQIIYRKNNLYIRFNNTEYRVIMFGENLQKSQKGCGSFTLAFLKHLLKNNAKILFDVIDVESKYSTEDKKKRDVEKKSCIRGVKFDIIKKQSFAPDIYKYSQNVELQKEFDDRKLLNRKDEIAISNYLKSLKNKPSNYKDIEKHGRGDIKFADYRKRHTLIDPENNKEFSNKIAKITLKYRRNNNKNNKRKMLIYDLIGGKNQTPVK